MTKERRSWVLGELLATQAAAHSDEPFLLCQPAGSQLSYAAVDARSAAAARRLSELGIAHGDRVGLMAGNTLEFVLAYFGALRMGAVIVPLNPALPQAAVAGILTHAGARLLLVEPEQVSRLHGLGEAGTGAVALQPLATITGDADLAASADAWSRAGSVGADDPAILLYTSGTTGAPKGVVLTQRNLLLNAAEISDALALGQARMMCVLPLHHTNGQVINLLAPLIAGGSVVLCGSYSALTLAAFWKTIAACQVNVVDVVPTILALLLSYKVHRLPDISSLRYIICGAAPLPFELQKRFEQRFGCAVIQEYGLTEATCVSTINSPTRHKPGSVGRPLPSSHIRIVDEGGADVAPGTAGEIIISGPALMKEYYRQPVLTAGTVRDGWLHTGDLGLADDDGFLSIVGRRKEVIIKGGETIYPLDIENALCQHGAVSECAVVGVEDAVYGESIKAFVVLNEGCAVTASELIAFCRGVIPPFWCPQTVALIPQLPKTPSGKVIKSQLQ